MAHWTLVWLFVVGVKEEGDLSAIFMVEVSIGEAIMGDLAVLHPWPPK